MPSTTLSDTAVRNAKPGLKPVKGQSPLAVDGPYKLSDEKGLFLLVTPQGGKWWRFKYRFGGKEQLLSLGTYPDVSLAKAREKRDEARRLLAAGVNPSLHRQAQQSRNAEAAANTFEAIALEWIAKQSPTWKPSHGDKVKQRLDRDVFPWLGKRPITEITAAELLAMLRRIESRGAIDTAHRASQNCGQVFRYAIVVGAQ